MGLMGIHRKNASKHMCFHNERGRDLAFCLDDARMRVTKYCVLSIRMDGAPGGVPLRSRN